MTTEQKRLDDIRKAAQQKKNRAMDRKIRKEYKDRQDVKHEVYNW